MKSTKRPDLESLLLSEDELDVAKGQIEKMAYLKWEAAGRPDGDGLKFWQQAESEWIEYYYVPDRPESEPPPTARRSPK